MAEDDGNPLKQQNDHSKINHGFTPHIQPWTPINAKNPHRDSDTNAANVKNKYLTPRTTSKPSKAGPGTILSATPPPGESAKIHQDASNTSDTLAESSSIDLGREKDRTRIMTRRSMTVSVSEDSVRTDWDDWNIDCTMARNRGTNPRWDRPRSSVSISSLLNPINLESANAETHQGVENTNDSMVGHYGNRSDRNEASSNMASTSVSYSVAQDVADANESGSRSSLLMSSGQNAAYRLNITTSNAGEASGHSLRSDIQRVQVIGKPILGETCGKGDCKLVFHGKGIVQHRRTCDEFYRVQWRDGEDGEFRFACRFRGSDSCGYNSRRLVSVQNHEHSCREYIHKGLEDADQATSDNGKASRPPLILEKYRWNEKDMQRCNTGACRLAFHRNYILRHIKNCDGLEREMLRDEYCCRFQGTKQKCTFHSSRLPDVLSHEVGCGRGRFEDPKTGKFWYICQFCGNQLQNLIARGWHESRYHMNAKSAT
ncbi:uncharacterized protein RSE6_11861 [Rhynchosporium secalis]|uniref:C2H2-type domain-containing protein n=1 Tax=Rhynchosporium secalis TaxID=38038 RepID=A0A1E1MP11_RHYSE|nr:uncharacterized protein RSE6_11861 [Rhynchosporium secalis]